MGNLKLEIVSDSAPARGGDDNFTCFPVDRAHAVFLGGVICAALGVAFYAASRSEITPEEACRTAVINQTLENVARTGGSMHRAVITDPVDQSVQFDARVKACLSRKL